MRVLKAIDVKHVDCLPLSDVELRGQAATGRIANKRRPSRKTLNDLQFLMKYIEARVKDADAWTDEHTLQNVDAMYQVVAGLFGAEGPNRNARATQARWSTYLNQIRKKLHREKEAREAREAEEVEGEAEEVEGESEEE